MARRSMRSRMLSRIPVPARLEQILDDVLDQGMAKQRPVMQRYLAWVQGRNPEMSPADVIDLLERRYRTAVIGIGGASGAAAAVPGVGTAASVATGAAEITAFVSATAMYVLGLAELHRVPMSDPEVRRALVIAVLVGEGAEKVIAGTASNSAHWATLVGNSTSKEKLGGINGRLTTMLLTRFGARQGALLFGRAMPLGIGAGIGAVGNAALARGAIKTARRAFGPAPKAFPPRVVDVPGPKRARRGLR